MSSFCKQLLVLWQNKICIKFGWHIARWIHWCSVWFQFYSYRHSSRLKLSNTTCTCIIKSWPETVPVQIHYPYQQFLNVTEFESCKEKEITFMFEHCELWVSFTAESIQLSTHHNSIDPHTVFLGDPDRMFLDSHKNLTCMPLDNISIFESSREIEQIRHRHVHQHVQSLKSKSE